VTVSGTKPWDGAPGGWRGSLAQLDTTQAPYGDIVALHPNHCFIPLISALDLATGDPFYNVAAAPDPAALSPFHAVYWAASNEEHVTIDAAMAQSVRAEVEGLVTVAAGDGRGPGGGAGAAAWAPRLEPPVPNPFRGSTRLAFTLPGGGAAEVRVFSAAGRAVRTLRAASEGTLGAGTHVLAWDGRDDAGGAAPAGLYFVRVALDGHAVTGRVVRLPGQVALP
jgi:hypothetical protein